MTKSSSTGSVVLDSSLFRVLLPSFLNSTVSAILLLNTLYSPVVEGSSIDTLLLWTFSLSQMVRPWTHEQAKPQKVKT